VHDAYVAGEGILSAAAFGIFNMANLRDTGELARGELIRFLAEAAWYPTALLPSQGVRWEEVDGCSARATLVDGDITVTLLFSFHEDGLIDSVLAKARGRTPGVSMPWRGRFWNHHIRNGMRVPLEASCDVTSTTLRTVALRQGGECDERRAQRSSEHSIREQSLGWCTAP
jgi:hypothetical protein